MKHYETECKKKMVRLHLEKGRSLKSFAVEYGVSHAYLTGQTNAAMIAKQIKKPKLIIIL